jgi:glycerol-3-phosphate acyltransferase PlsY
MTRRKAALFVAGTIAAVQTIAPFLAVLAAYLLGSLAFAVLVSRVMGLSDPRTFGSKNPGATNVLRSGNKAAAIVTLLLDALKGFVPVLLVKLYGRDYGLGDGTMAMVGLAAFVGHLFPVFFRFQGGKGVATFIGVVFGIHWLLGVATCLTWIIIAAFFRYSSLASLVAAVFAPVFYLLVDRVQWYAEKPVAVALFVMAMLLAWRHRANIQRLMQGKESKLGAKKDAAAAAHADAHHGGEHHHHRRHH